jgi:hypothetical protein
MNTVEYAVALFDNSQWEWRRETIKDILAANQAAFIQEDCESERDCFAGVNGEKITFAYGQDPRAPFVEILLQEQALADLEENARSEIIAAYDAAYEKIVARVRELLGDYVFEGTSAGNALTQDQYGDLCACWVKGHVRLMVQELQSDRDLPIQLSIFIAPQKMDGETA